MDTMEYAMFRYNTFEVVNIVMLCYVHQQGRR